MVVFPDALDPLLQDPKCGLPTLKVLLWAWKNLSFERWAHLSQREVAGGLSLSQAAVSRALADLADQGFLERQGSGPRQEWRLTPEAGWRGTAANYQKTKRLRAAGEGKPRLRVVGKPQDPNRAGPALVSADIDQLG